MNRWLTFIVLGSLCCAAAAFAGPPFGGPEPGIARMLERHADEIGLDDATLTRIRAVVAAAKEEEEGLHRSTREARHGLRDLLEADDPDEAAVMRQAEVLGALETEALKHRLRTLLAVRPMLTDEQFAKLRDLRHARFAAVREACAADVRRLCPDEGDDDRPGRGAFHCLRRHADEVSAACREALQQARDAKRR